jgi:copper chaperone
MVKETIKIKGMSCQHCVMNVKKALNTLAGVSSADVEMGSATVTYDETVVKKTDITGAIEVAGYEVAA